MRWAHFIPFVSIFLFASCLVDPLYDNLERFYMNDGLVMEWQLHDWLEINGAVVAESYYTIKMEHVGYESRNGYMCYKFLVSGYLPDSSLTGTYQYLANTDTGLIFVDIEGDALPVIFRNNNASHYKVRMRDGSFVNLKDFIQMVNYGSWATHGGLEEPQLTLSYPMHEGKKWVVFERPWLRTREIVGTEEVNTPAGNFYTFVLRTDDPGLDYEISITDWITGEAWVKKRMKIKVRVYDNSGNFIGSGFFVSEAILTNVEWR